MSKTPSLAKGRGKARKFAMQAIYQWQMTNDDMDDITKGFIEESEMQSVDMDFFKDALNRISTDVTSIDSVLEKHMKMSIDEVDQVERSILRLAGYEILCKPDIPFKVILNEAIILSRKFCAENSHTFINGVLDQVSRDVRKKEIT